MTETAVETPVFRHFIAGEWCESTSGETFESHNPADTRDVVGRFQAGTKADVAMAIKAAETAFPMWRRTPAPKRGEILYAFGALMAQHKERLARAMTREMGKVLTEARGDVQEGIDIAYLMAGEGRRMAGETVPSELPDKWAMSIRQPLGVAGIITPWNFPMAIPCWKTMPALVTGNTVVFKPSSDTPHCATLLVELMADAGFPPGVVNLVTGSGAEVGDAMVDSPEVAVISFTGASTTGKRIAERAGRHLKHVSLELGGKNGVVVLGDADLDLATDGILWSAFGTTGQRCTAASRVIVERSVVEPLLQRLESRARKLRLGSGLDPAVDVGPLINAGAADKVSSYVDIGRGEAELVLGGERADEGRSRARPFLRTDDLHRRRRDGPDRAGGDLRTGPLDHPGRRLRVRDAGAQPDPLRPLIEHLHPRREPGVPRDARLRDGDRLRQRRDDWRRGPPAVRRLEGDRQRPPRGRATSRSTPTPSGSRSTSTSRAASSAPRSTTSPAERRVVHLGSSAGQGADHQQRYSQHEQDDCGEELACRRQAPRYSPASHEEVVSQRNDPSDREDDARAQISAHRYLSPFCAGVRRSPTLTSPADARGACVLEPRPTGRPALARPASRRAAANPEPGSRRGDDHFLAGIQDLVGRDVPARVIGTWRRDGEDSERARSPE